MPIKEIKKYPVQCDLCGSDSCELLWENRNIQYQLSSGEKLFIDSITNVICTRCGFVYQNPRLTEEVLSEIYSNYLWPESFNQDLIRDRCNSFL